MAKVHPDELKKMVQNDDDFSGAMDEEVSSASNPERITDKDTEETLEELIGKKPDPERDGFSIAEEIDNDTNALDSDSDGLDEEEGDWEEDDSTSDSHLD